MTNKADLLLHPVRLRIVLAVSGDEVTTAQIAERLPDVPTATLYRHVATLAEHGILETVAEHRVRGGVERTYGLATGEATVGPAEAAEMTREEHQRGFVTFVGTLIEAFGRYLESTDADPAVDTVGYRQIALWLSDDEAARLVAELGEVLAPYAVNERSPERHRILLSTIVVPDAASSRAAASNG